MQRGWTTAYHHLSERRQRDMLLEAGVGEHALYPSSEWDEFVRNLRPGDEAVVADLRIFGSRKRLGELSAEIAARGAILVTAAGTCIHQPTLEEVQRTESIWNRQRSMGGSKRAKALNAKALEAKRAKARETRRPDAEARAIWKDEGRYPLTRDALKAMGYPSYVTAWRKFGKRAGK
jgi:hypothetical protein